MIWGFDFQCSSVVGRYLEVLIVTYWHHSIQGKT